MEMNRGDGYDDNGGGGSNTSSTIVRVRRRLDPLAVRAALGRHEWGPPRPFGDEGWVLVRLDREASAIVSAFDWSPEGGIVDGDGSGTAEWLHASYARHDRRMPSYEELQALHKAVFGDGWAYQAFAPSGSHVNIHDSALHLWGRTDGAPAIPDFVGTSGTV